MTVLALARVVRAVGDRRQMASALTRLRCPAELLGPHWRALGMADDRRCTAEMRTCSTPPRAGARLAAVGNGPRRGRPRLPRHCLPIPAELAPRQGPTRSRTGSEPNGPDCGSGLVPAHEPTSDGKLWCLGSRMRGVPVLQGLWFVHTGTRRGNYWTRQG